MLDFQVAFNIVFGAFSGLAGWLLNTLYNSMKDLTQADKELADKVQAIEVLVAGQYPTRSEFEAKMDAVFRKLDSIESKIDRKADKQGS